MAHAARTRAQLDFADFTTPQLHPDGRWVVLDPVNPENNVVPRAWGNIELQEIADWLDEARDGMARVIAADLAGREGAVREELEALFGSAVLRHAEGS
jgi:hypothetical protein